MSSKLLVLLKQSLWILIPALLFSTGCKKDDDDTPPVTVDDPIASFQFAVSETNFLEVSFTNFSQNADSYAWDFGDGNTSTDESPTHTYAGFGDYTITLTATNSAGTSADRSENLSIVDPDGQLTLLAGQTSKTWYIQREGIALGIGPAVNDNGWWSFGGVTPLAERPCILDDSYTFHRDGTFEFNSGGTLFVDASGNGGWIINGEDQEGCYDESDPATWGDDASRADFGSGGDYTFEMDNANNTLTLNGSGAYIGLPVKTEAGDNNLPVQIKSFSITNLADGDVADSLHVSLIGADFAWNFYLVSYENAADLPAIPTDVPVFGEDLPDISPTEMFRTFASNDASDWGLLDTIPSNSDIVYGVDDPADATAAKVGQFERTEEQFQELQFQTAPTKHDINFENLTTVSIEVYLPSSNDYSGTLTRGVILGLGDASQTAQWWTDNREYVTDGDLALDEWITLTYNLDSPNAGSGTYTPYDRNDLDMFYINIGGVGHPDPGTFYVRNLRFE